ncbi:hypothetical protein D9M68_532730 [compost metagenome]
MHGDERGAHRHFGLAEADVAADQPVHRLGGEHVVAHRLDGGLLVRGFLEREAGAEGFVVGLRVGEGEAFAGGTAGVDVEQLGGDVAHLLGGLALGLLPGFRTEAVQRRQGVVAAGVAGDQVQAGHRHVELGFLGVLQGEEFRGLALDLQGDQAQVAADAMVDVHHGRTLAQFGEVLDHVVAGIAAALAAAALHHPLAEQRAFGDQRQPRVIQQQAFVQGGDGDGQALGAGDERWPAFDFLRTQLEAGEHLQQHLAAPGGFGAEQHAAGEFVEEAAQGRQRFAGLGLDRQVGQGAGGEALTTNAGFDVFLAQYQARRALEPGEAILHREEQLGGRHQRALRVDATFLIAVAHVVPELVGSLFDPRQGEHLGVLGQVIEEGGGFLEEQRQVVLDAGRGDAAGQVLVDRAAPEVDVEALAEAPTEIGHGLLVQRELACRQQADRLDLVDRALGFRVEGAQRLDLVVEQVDAVGLVAAHREQVDQRAAHGELAVLVDGVHAAVAGGLQAQAHLRGVELLADVQHQAGAEQETGRRQAVQGGGDRHHQHAVLDLRQAVEGGDALGNDVLVRREQVVGQGFPVREVQHRQVRRKEAQLLLQALGALAVGGQQQGEALGGAGGLGDGEGLGGAGQVAPVLPAGTGRQGRKTQYGHGQRGSGRKKDRRIVTMRTTCCQSRGRC